MADPRQLLNKSRTDVRPSEPVKRHDATITNGEQRSGGIAEAMADSGVVRTPPEA